MKLEYKYTALKKKVKNFLQDLGAYESVDDILIDELVFFVRLADEAKKDIVVHGLTKNITRDPDKPPFYQTNQSVNIYSTAVKQIQSLSTKLGINSQERSKLKLTPDKEDELDELLNG